MDNVEVIIEETNDNITIIVQEGDGEITVFPFPTTEIDEPSESRFPVFKNGEQGWKFLTYQSLSASIISASEGFVNVLNYGPVGMEEGIIDATTAIQNAFNAANGLWVFFPPGDYRITSSLNTPVGTKINAYGARVFNTTTHIYMINGDSNLIIKGMELEGNGAETPSNLGRGINIIGTVGVYKSNITLEDCYIHDVGYYGVYLQFVENFKVESSRVHNIGYGGIFGLSVSNGQVDKNWVKSITGDTGGYNISFTRESTVDTLEANPRSKNVNVSNCLVEDNITWKGLDTHGGDNINFYNNWVFNCLQGIGIVASNNFAPKNSKIIGNTVFSNRGTDVTASDAYGIVVAGKDTIDLSTSIDFADNCHVIGNTFIGVGKESAINSGGCRFRNTYGLVFTNNIITQPLVTGVLIQHTNYNFTVSGNTIEDPNSSDTGLFTSGIRVSSVYNVGTITNNNIRLRNAGLNTLVGDRGIHVSTATNNKLVIRQNPNNCILPLNIPYSRDIITDFLFTDTIRIARTPSDNNIQMLFDEGFLMYADNDGGQNVLDPVAFWLAGRANTTVYIHPRSGRYKWFSVNAETFNIASGKLRIDGDSATLEPTGATKNVSGLASSGVLFRNGIHYTVISAGLANNYPENGGLSYVIKANESRIIEYFSNLTGVLWYRSLNDVGTNTWKRVLAEGDIETYLKAQSGYNASAAQNFTHDSSGNFLWVNI